MEKKSASPPREPRQVRKWPFGPDFAKMIRRAGGWRGLNTPTSCTTLLFTARVQRRRRGISHRGWNERLLKRHGYSLSPFSIRHPIALKHFHRAPNITLWNYLLNARHITSAHPLLRDCHTSCSTDVTSDRDAGLIHLSSLTNRVSGYLTHGTRLSEIVFISH